MLFDKLDYDFVFFDGPSYNDDNGSSFCSDILEIMEISNSPVIRGVIDTRVSSVFVLQTIFGSNSIRYYPFFRTASFELRKLDLKIKLSASDFKSNFLGRLRLCLR